MKYFKAISNFLAMFAVHERIDNTIPNTRYVPPGADAEDPYADIIDDVGLVHKPEE